MSTEELQLTSSQDVEEIAPVDTSKILLNRIRKHWLVISLLTAVVLGLMIGLMLRLRPEPYTKREVMYVSFLGTLLLQLLQCISIPLITTSIIAALAQLDMKTSGKIGIRTIVYFLSTSFVSSIVGTILVLVMQPGSSKHTSGVKVVKVIPASLADSFLDIIRNMVPNNLIEAWMYTANTRLIPPEKPSSIPISEWDFDMNHLVEAPNFLGLIVASVVFGFAVGYMKNEIEDVIIIITTINELFISVTYWIIYLSPPGIFCLLVGQIIELEDVGSTVRQMGMYTACCVSGFLFIGLVFLPILYTFFARKNPIKFLYTVLPVATTAFATASSLATIPTTMKYVEEVAHVDPRISRFVIPLAATSNMNATALYNTIGPIFLAQLSGVNLGFGHYASLCVVSTVASIGIAAIPQGSILTMVMLLGVVNVNPEMISIAFTMDWLLDRFCTSADVMGDVVAAIAIDVLSKKGLSNS